MQELHGISDPGETIVKSAIQNQIEVIPIPGACAFVNSLIVSGISAKEFAFYGFLPLNKKNRKEKLEQIKREHKTIIVYEAPHKLQKTLQDFLETVGDKKACLVRELTKVHEEKIQGMLSELIQKMQNPKGEFVIILDLNSEEQSDIEEKQELKQMTLPQHYEFYEKLGLEKKEIIKQIAKDRGVSKNEIYQEFVKKEL